VAGRRRAAWSSAVAPHRERTATLKGDPGRGPYCAGPKARRRGGPALGAAITGFGREGYRSTPIAGIARDAHAGSTVAYAYLPGREAMFHTAADQDASGIVREELAAAVASAGARNGASHFFRTIADVLDRHPLARRLCTGLEPQATSRVLEIPALTELRNPVRGAAHGPVQRHDPSRH